MDEFEGRVALVTGGASGMGKAVAGELAARGALVAVLDVRPTELEQAKRELKSPAGQEHLAVPADVTNADAVRAAVASVVTHCGGVDLLCNSAGIPDDATPCHEMSLEQWQKVLAIDLTGPFLVSREVLPSMISRGGGAIVNIASIAGLVASAGGVAYTAAKHGLVGLTKRMATEYGPRGIQVNAVCPGYIATPMNVPYRDMLKEVIAATPAGRWAEPDEVAALVVHLMSGKSRYMMGAAIPIDGGATAL